MPADKIKPLERMFYPASVAVVGASSSAAETGWVKRLLDFGYKGKIYPVNPKVREIRGLTAYANISDAPDPVDYAILNVPARSTLQALRDCVAKGVKFVHCYTAGFGEDGSDEGKRLESEMTKMITGSRTRLLGPNCMGIYCPESGMTFSEDFPKEKGRIAVVSQSGAEASRLVLLCQDVNLYFSKVISYGNAADLDALGLAEACRNFCRQFQARTNLVVRTRLARFAQRCPPAMELNLFRIVQEALNNVARHASAHRTRPFQSAARARPAPVAPAGQAAHGWFSPLRAELPAPGGWR